MSSPGDPTIIDTSPGTGTIATSNSTTRSGRSKLNETRSYPPPKTASSSRSKSRLKENSSSKHVISGDGRNKASRECVCGRGTACFGMSQAFRLLGDPRSYYVELPRYRNDPPAFKYVFRNNLRQAYLRYLIQQNPTNKNLQELLSASVDTDGRSSKTSTRSYVALHHFHPTIVRAFYENPLTSAQKHKVPISITQHELDELGMECLETDRILSASGNPTGGYYFTPSYPHEKTHDDLKILIQSLRTSSRVKSKKSSPGTSSSKKLKDPNVPTDIEITTQTKNEGNYSVEPAIEYIEQSQQSTDRKEKQEIDQSNENDSSRVIKDASEDLDISNDTNEIVPTTEEFDKIWEKPPRREIESNLVKNTIIEEEEECMIREEENDEAIGDHSENGMGDATVNSLSTQSTAAASLSSRRTVDRPWATPKYRRDRDIGKRRSSGAAHYIDPHNTGELQSKLAITPEIIDDGEDIARIAADMTVFQQHHRDEEKDDTISPIPTFLGSPKRFPSTKTSFSPKRSDDEVSLSSAESGASSVANYVKLSHQLPGTDPTLRIQVHNDLIAWESKRRSDLAQQLEYNRERWRAACSVMNDGISEIQYADRFILGIIRSSRLFADSLRAVYDDTLLDDKGNTVTNTFMQNRLAKKRSTFEYSIENTVEDSKQGSGQSLILDSIVNAQLKVANAFMENSEHMEQEILPEINELKEEVCKSSQKLQSVGDVVILELERSEIEVKNIWGKFDLNITNSVQLCWMCSLFIIIFPEYTSRIYL